MLRSIMRVVAQEVSGFELLTEDNEGCLLRLLLRSLPVCRRSAIGPARRPQRQIRRQRDFGSRMCVGGPAGQMTNEGRSRSSAVLGLDIGGTKLAAGVVDSTGQIRSFMSAPTPPQGWRAAMEVLLALGDQVLAAAHLRPIDLEGIGIGCGGPSDIAAGTVTGPPNLPGWESVPVVEVVTEHFGRAAVLENDGSAAALATYLWGKWSGIPDLVYLTISSGIGSGVITGGELFRGAAGNGGEIGHSLVAWNGRLCGCGQRGCAEAYVSGHSIARRAHEAIAAGRSTAMTSIATMPTAKDVAAAAAGGDQLARELWDETTTILGRVVASILNVLEPQLVVLGGGVAQAGSMLLEPVRAAALAQAMPPAARAADVVQSSHGAAVGVLGGAAAALLSRGRLQPTLVIPALQGAPS